MRMRWLVLVMIGCGSSGGGDTTDANTSSCREAWSCTSWEAPMGSDMATRTCVDTNEIGTTECKPSEGPMALPQLDLEMYKCDIHPIIQRGCGQMGCHGTETERGFRVYTRGRLRNNETVNRTGTCIPQTGTVNLQMAASGTVMCEGWLPHTTAEWKKSYDSARSFMIDVATPSESQLVTEPTFGGPAHANIKMFRTTDTEYTKLVTWLGGAQRGSVCNTGKN